MKKVGLEIVKQVLTRSKLDDRKASEILEELQRMVAAETEEKAPRVKKEHVVVVSDPNGVIKGVDITGWVLQIPEGESPALVLEKVFRAAYDFNNTPKGRRLPVGTVGEAFESVAAKFFKEQGLWVKTKEPVLVVRTDNRIPKE